MEVDLEAKLGMDGHSTEGRVANGGGGDAKGPREEVRCGRSMEMWDDEDEDDWGPPPNPLDSYRQSWIDLYGANLSRTRDSLLELRGPRRAVLLMDHPVFEIDLKVKGKGSPSELLKTRVCHNKGVSSEHNTTEIKFAHLTYAVEATITVRVVGGSSDFRACNRALTASIDEDVVLLDSQGGKVAVADDGLVMLRRHVVVVEEKGELILGVEATQGDTAENNTTGVKQQPRTALRSEVFFDLGFCRLHVMIAWSMLP